MSWFLRLQRVMLLLVDDRNGQRAHFVYMRAERREVSSW